MSDDGRLLNLHLLTACLRQHALFSVVSRQNCCLLVIFLAKGIIHVRKLQSTRVLIIRHERVQLSLRRDSSLQRAWLSSDYILRRVRLDDGPSLASVEVAKALGRRLASDNVGCLERGLKEVGVLTSWWEYVWLIAFDRAYLEVAFFFVSD